MGFSETNLRKKMVDFAEKFRSNLAEKRSFKNSRTFLIKQDSNFAHFWGGGKWWALACAITTTETPTTYKFCLFKRGDFELKTPACFAMPFGLGILLHRFFLSEIIINFALLTTMSSEMYQWQSFLCRALASAQFFSFFSLRWRSFKINMQVYSKKQPKSGQNRVVSEQK